MSADRRSAAARSSSSDDIYRDVEEAAHEVEEFVEEQMKERPYTSLVVAAALGYALGLPRGSIAMLTGLGARLATGWRTRSTHL